MTASGPRERGGCLTLYLIVIVIGSILGLIAAFSLSSTANQLAAQGFAVAVPSWYGPAWIVSIILSLAGAYGTWNWKKWGVYLLIANLVFSAAISVAAGQALSAIIGLIIAGAILWYLLRNKWAFFEG
jgi:hypothetical protein